MLSKAHPNIPTLLAKSLLTFIILIAAFLRFYNLNTQGFSDTDEFSSFQFLRDHLDRFTLEGIAGGMWGRPVGFLISYLPLKIFGFDPVILGFKSALMGIGAVFVIYIIGERWLGKLAGLFSATFSATLFSLVYYSRNMKQLSDSVFLCSTSTYCLMNLISVPSVRNFALTGISVGVMITTHPNTIPLGTVMLMIAGALTLYHMTKESVGHRSGIFLRAWICPLTVLSLMGSCELFFIIIKNFFPFWDIVGEVGYFSNLLYHSTTWVLGPPTFAFYLGALSHNGVEFLNLGLIGMPLLLLFPNRRIPGLILLTIFWCPIAIWVVTEVAAVERNVLTAFVPACLSAGALLAIPLQQLLQLGYRTTTSVLTIFFVISIALYGINYSRENLYDQSSSEGMIRYMNGAKASFTRPSKSVYYWSDYYFPDRDTWVETWKDVLKTYLVDGCEFLARLLPEETSAKELVSADVKGSKAFRNLGSNRASIYYDLVDLRGESPYLKKNFGFTKIHDERFKDTEVKIQKRSDLVTALPLLPTQASVTIPLNSDILVLSGWIDTNSEAVLVSSINANKSELPTSILLSKIAAGKSRYLVIRHLDSNHFKQIDIAFTAFHTQDSSESTEIRISDLQAQIFILDSRAKDTLGLVPPIQMSSSEMKRVGRVLTRVSKSNKLSELKFLDVESGPTRILLPSSSFSPYRNYRVRFEGKTNFQTVGEGLVVARRRGDSSETVLGRSKFFWKPWWSTYSFNFSTSDSVANIILALVNGKEHKPLGHVQFRNVKIELVQ